MSDDSDLNVGSNLNSLDCWDYSIELECLQGNADLQLAAELGKTLLERNKELETALKQHQNVIEDQAQEIEYLTKQTVALREVNDSRLRIYEQLEVSIQDLERANHRLVLDNSAEKKHVKTLNTTIESLEAKCEDLQSTTDELRLQVDVLKRKSRRTSDVVPSLSVNKENIVTLRHVQINKEDTRPVSPDSSATHIGKTECDSTPGGKKKVCESSTRRNENSESESQCYEDMNQSADEPDSGIEQMAQLMTQLRETRSQLSRDDRRISELEEQLATMVQQNQALENQVIQLHHREDDMNMKSMHEELTTLEEVRQGQMCSRCLRTMDQSGSEVPDDDDASMLDELMTSEHRSSFTMDVQDKTRLEAYLRRDMSVMWISPAANLFSLLIDLCLYVKDAYLVPYFSRPIRFPFVLVHYCLFRHKLH